MLELQAANLDLISASWGTGLHRPKFTSSHGSFFGDSHRKAPTWLIFCSCVNWTLKTWLTVCGCVISSLKFLLVVFQFFWKLSFLLYSLHLTSPGKFEIAIYNFSLLLQSHFYGFYIYLERSRKICKKSQQLTMILFSFCSLLGQWFWLAHWKNIHTHTYMHTRSKYAFFYYRPLNQPPVFAG